MDAQAYAAGIEAWRERRLARLTAPDGWLSVVGLHWLEDGANRIGGSAAAVPAPERLGELIVSGGSAALRRGGAASLSTASTPSATAPAPLEADSEGERPFLTHGALSFSLIRRGGRLGVRVRDREAAARARTPRIPYFPVDPAWRFDARFAPYDPPRRAPVASVAGTEDAEVFSGAIVFVHEGSEHRLDAIAERGETDFWIVFGDATNGRETYGGGRFVYAPPAVHGRTVLDFNEAYNPPCVFTPYSTCPLPLPQNRLPFRVEAGEMAYKGQF